jgi:hypothetical protein
MKALSSSIFVPLVFGYLNALGNYVGLWESYQQACPAGTLRLELKRMRPDVEFLYQQTTKTGSGLGNQGSEKEGECGRLN